MFRRKYWKINNLFSSNGKRSRKNCENGEKITKAISYRLQFADSPRFMASSLSNIVNSLAKKFIKLNVNTDVMIKKYETCGIKYKDCECCLECTTLIDDLME